jgi:hypothetical protein
MSTTHTRKISQQIRFIIEKESVDQNYLECSHGLCDTLHKRWHRGGVCMKPRADVIEWYVKDTNSTDHRSQRFYLGYCGSVSSFDTKREAVAALTDYLNSMTDIEWQQIAKAGA